MVGIIVFDGEFEYIYLFREMASSKDYGALVQTALLPLQWGCCREEGRDGISEKLPQIELQ